MTTSNKKKTYRAARAGAQEALQPGLATRARGHSRGDEGVTVGLEGLEVLLPEGGSIARVEVGLTLDVRPDGQWLPTGLASDKEGLTR